MTFDIEEFRKVHNHNNQLANISDDTIQFWVNASIMLLGLEKDNCIITDEAEKALALQLLVCHISSIVAKGMVGAISNASEGSVSLGTQIPPSLSQSWLCTTPCGLFLWQLMAKYRKGMRWYPFKR